MELVSSRFKNFPLNGFRYISDPLDLSLREHEETFIITDFTDIYFDLKGTLVLYEKEFVEEAVWDWRFSFYSHWGYHVLSGLNALHFFFIKNYGAIDIDKYLT